MDKKSKIVGAVVIFGLMAAGYFTGVLSIERIAQLLTWMVGGS